MKNLQQFVVEGLSDIELEEYIKNNISNISSKLKQEIYDIMTNNNNPVTEDVLLLIKNKIGTEGFNIFNRVKRTSEVNDCINDMVKNQNFIEFNDLLRHKNIFDLIREKVNNIDIKYLKNIANLSILVGGKGVGKFEILLRLFLNGGYNLINGDVGLDDGQNKLKIEVKANGRIKKSDPTPSLYHNKLKEEIINFINKKRISSQERQSCIDKVNDYFEQNFNNNSLALSNDKNIEMTFQILKDIGVTDKDMIDILSNSLPEQFKNISSNLNNLSSQLKDLLKSKKSYFFNNMIPNTNSNSINSSNPFSLLFGLMDMYIYCDIDDWNYLISFTDDISKKDFGKYSIISREDIIDLKTLFNKASKGHSGCIYFSGNPSNTARNTAVFIHPGSSK